LKLALEDLVEIGFLAGFSITDDVVTVERAAVAAVR